jgi:hypothetical protein
VRGEVWRTEGGELRRRNEERRNEERRNEERRKKKTEKSSHLPPFYKAKLLGIDF